MTPTAECVKDILDAWDFPVPSDRSAMRRFVAALVWHYRCGVFGPTDRAWTGEAGSARTGASRKSFREPGGAEVSVIAMLAERQALDS